MKLRITVEGVSYDVEVEVVEDAAAPAPAPVAAPPAAASAPAAPPRPGPRPSADASSRTFPSPLAGTVIKILVKPGDEVALNQKIMVMEAMKMETDIVSPVAGVVGAVSVSEGEAVRQGQTLLEYR